MEDLIAAQQDLHGRIARACDNLKKIGAAKITLNHVRSALALLEKKWNKFEEQHKTLATEGGADLKDHVYFTDHYADEVEASYLEQHGSLLDMQKTFDDETAVVEARSVKAEASSSRHSLPKLEIPRFSGEFQDWPAFRDLFQSMVVQESSLSKVEKLHYLKTRVDGEANRLIRSLPSTEDNFDRSWEILKSHYENDTLLVRAYLTAFTALPAMKTDSVDDLRTIFHGVVSTVGSLEGIGRPLYSCEDLFVHLVVDLLDSKTRLACEMSLGRSVEPPSYAELRDFLQEQLMTREVFRITRTETSAAGKTSKPGRGTRANLAKKQRSDSGRCPACKGDHFIMYCDNYKQSTPRKRREMTEAYHLCWNCLGRHQVSGCSSPKSCGKCAARHHTSLHDAFVSAAPASVVSAPASATVLVAEPVAKSATVLLATARVLVLDHLGARHSVRALVDSGSEACMVTESLAQRLRLSRTPTSVAIFGIGGQQTGVSRGRIALALAPRTGQTFFTVSALVFPRLMSHGSSINRRAFSWPHLDGLELADPDFGDQDPVELLLGADAFAHIALPGLRKGGPHEPIAQQTTLGWIILGAAGSGLVNSAVTSLHCSPVDELTSLVRRFWEQEEPPRAPLPLTADEQACEEHFVRTHARESDGRYVVRLPVRLEAADLASTQRAALRMLGAMERRFRQDARLQAHYHDFLDEYLSLGHMSPAMPVTPGTPRVCFLPHHGVWKGSGGEAKIRVVFNGSARTLTGMSLNDCLHPGPNLLPTLYDVVTSWRRHRFVLAADIQKMYRQVLVHPEDRDLQRIFWKQNDRLVELRLNTVTYGLASAPYLAIRVLRQLADDDGESFPLAAEALRQSTYMDDILAGASTVEEALLLREQLSRLCSAGGFPLRRWSANVEDLLQGVPLDHRSSRPSSAILETKDQSVLGLRWDPVSDCFALTVRRPSARTATKRSVLSVTAQLFDPLGWLAPITVRAKLLVQSAWLQQLDWDAPLAAEEANCWPRLEAELPLLEDVRVPRWMRCDAPGVRMEIHGFADASERAYAAVVYLRSIVSGEVHRSLVMAKTRVSPLRRVSLPRLELCAAALLAKLVAHVQITLNLTDSLIYLWTDSTVTLGWIRSHPARWATFVANRVAEIQRLVADGQWRHVPGRDNPADCASRGVSPRELLAHELWWRGPAFLSDDESGWPTDPGRREVQELPEQRPKSCLAASRLPEPEELTRFSSLQRLLRVTAWMCRWMSRRGPACAGFVRCTAFSDLSAEEVQLSLERWIRIVQRCYFSTELEAINAGQDVPARSPLRRLSPTLDNAGLLRVGGRLKHSLLSADQRHPLLLPPDSHLTRLVIGFEHRRTQHGGTQMTLAAIRQRFWLPRGRQLVRRHIHQCIRCARWRAASPRPLMGSLPRDRVTPSRLFLTTGVDFAGPILLRTTKGRGHKAYKAFLAVFICFSTRAVHLEVVSDYTSDAFLAAFRRFVSRCGLCQTIYSDCGTNFVGADSQLRALFEAASQDVHRIIGRLASEGVHWRFNPTAAPHFGGLWEAAVKSMKHHLRRVVGETRLTFEEMTTFLAEVEACLNSRPLQALTDDPDDLEALTPGHFLIGGPLNAIPEPSLLDVPVSRLSRWRLLQNMRDHLWQRWAQEYLQGLSPRPKWWKTSPNLREGQLCLLRSENTPPTRWPLARIVGLHPKDDGQVRVVDVRTPTGTFTRPVVKIVPLLAAGVD